MSCSPTSCTSKAEEEGNQGQVGDGEHYEPNPDHIETNQNIAVGGRLMLYGKAPVVSQRCSMT